MKHSTIFSPNKTLVLYILISKSLNSRFVGAATTCLLLNISIKKTIDKNASIYIAECIALSSAMDIVSKNPSSNNLIISDSLSDLASISSTSFKATQALTFLILKRRIINTLQLIQIVT